MNCLKISKPKYPLGLNDSLPEELERLINLAEVDWTGRLVGKAGFNFKPVPVISNTSALYSLITHWSRILQKALFPANPEDVFMELSKFKLHFLGVPLEERENEMLVSDYVAELSLFPIDLIELVCREYRLNEKNKFFPKLKELRLMLITPLKIRISKSNRLLALIEASENDLIQP